MVVIGFNFANITLALHCPDSFNYLDERGSRLAGVENEDNLLFSYGNGFSFTNTTLALHCPDNFNSLDGRGSLLDRMCGAPFMQINGEYFFT